MPRYYLLVRVKERCLLGCKDSEIIIHITHLRKGFQKGFCQEGRERGGGGEQEEEEEEEKRQRKRRKKNKENKKD